MMKKLALLSLVVLVACGDDGTTDTTDGAEDMGPAPVDMFRPAVDMFRPAVDMGGSADPCVPSGDDFTETVGCNGEPLGSDVAMNDFAGECVGGTESMPAGTCTGAMALCSATEGETGYCLAFCEADADDYITTGGCPTGSRCFTLDTDFALCFPDCRTSADCLDGYECDGEGSCVEGTPPPVDGGMGDDMGTDDMGTDLDASVGLDAGVGLDGSVPPIDAASP